MTIIKSKKFILRPYRKGDEEAVARHAHDKEIAANTAVPYPYTLKDAKEWVKINLTKYNKPDSDHRVFAIEIDGEACGTVSLCKIVKEHKAELGYWLGRKYWGQGVMIEVVKLITKYGFKELKLRRIYAHVYLFNPASKKVLEKAGYETEGILKKEAKKGGKYIDAYLLAKVKK